MADQAVMADYPGDTAEPSLILAWAARHFRPRIALSCSFGGPGGLVLAHMLAQVAPDVPLLFIDTQYLFPETYALRDLIVERYGLQVITVTPDLKPDEQAAQYGPALWLKDPDKCCQIRKVEPMAKALASLDAWITALRRDQSSTRAGVNTVETHLLAGRTLVKVNPLAHWNRQQVWDYLLQHDIPYNPKHDEGYPSLGCIQCTRPVEEGRPERAGRWVGHNKTECGLHTFTRQA